MDKVTEDMARVKELSVLIDGDKTGYLAPVAGLSLRSVEWMREQDVAAAATDTIVFEVFPWERDDAPLPSIW